MIWLKLNTITLWINLCKRTNYLCGKNVGKPILCIRKGLLGDFKNLPSGYPQCFESYPQN